MDVALVQYINRLCRHLAITPARLHPHEVYLDPADAADPRISCLLSMYGWFAWRLFSGEELGSAPGCPQVGGMFLWRLSGMRGVLSLALLSPWVCLGKVRDALQRLPALHAEFLAKAGAGNTW